MTPSVTPLLATQDLGLKRGQRLLLSGLSLTLEAGQFWCVLGPNGSGKTTLLSTLAGLQAAERGRVVLTGRALSEWPPGEAARIRGLLPQTISDAFGARVLDLVLMGRHPHLGRWSWEGPDDHTLALQALRAVQMDWAAERDILTLSGGERQRVGVATLLAQDPRLLLLDEPLAHLDLPHQVATLRHLRGLVERGDRAVLMSMHDLNLARRAATHALLLDGRGGVPLLGPVEQVMRAEHLSAAFGHPLRELDVEGQVLFVAA